MSDDAIAERWRELRAERRAALIPYLTAGYPTPSASLEALRHAARGGADFIEVGVPFSDPLADGPTIQRSTQCALDQGVDLAAVLELVRQAQLDIPVVVMTYVNPVLAYGVDRFLADAHAARVAGVLLTDLPVGADPPLERQVGASPLALIRLVAPTTTAARLAHAMRDAAGFVYLISRLGVTGARAAAPPDLEAHVERVRRATALPVAVGFGLSNAEQAAHAARLADGVVVGSALVEALGAGGPVGVESLVRDLAAAMRGARS